jgi:hypothetical protein
MVLSFGREIGAGMQETGEILKKDSKYCVIEHEAHS